MPLSTKQSFNQVDIGNNNEAGKQTNNQPNSNHKKVLEAQLLLAIATVSFKRAQIPLG